MLLTIVYVPRRTDTRCPPFPLQPCSLHRGSNCLESAVVLSTLLSHLRMPGQLPSLLYAYHDLRAAARAGAQEPELHEPVGPPAECAGPGSARVHHGDGGRICSIWRRCGQGAQERRRRATEDVVEGWRYNAREEAEEWW